MNMCSMSLVERLGEKMSKSSVQLLFCNATSMVDKKVDFMATRGAEENSIFVDKIVDVSIAVSHLRNFVLHILIQKTYVFLS